VLSDDQYVEALTSPRRLEEVCAELPSLSPDRARTIIFRGTGEVA
jgi:hypothetical protein